MLILDTKLFVPSLRPDRVPRPQLARRLHEGVVRPLTLVAAPAGFGKTTLVSEWVRAGAQPAAWVSLDAGDNDPVRFWTYVALALQKLDARLGVRALALLQPTGPLDGAAVAAVLLNEVVAAEEHYVLVLDDYHVITAQSIHEALGYLLDHLPEQLRVVIITRADPPLPLARLRARQHLTELRAADLRFTGAEAAAFFQDAMHIRLTAPEVATLAARTEGWIAGLHLAALSLQNRSDTAGFVAGFTGTHHFVLDYVAEEVLHRQSGDVQEFLLQTSILDRLCGPLCDAVLGRDGGQARLEWLEQAGLFVIPLDDDRRWYRYHHLFADVLQARLRRVHPELEAVLHSRAAAWHGQNGLPDVAIRHALTGGDLEQAATLVEQVGAAMLASGELATLLAWLRAFPAGWLHRRPWLAVFQAWASVLTGQMQAVEPALGAVSDGGPAPDGGDLRVQGHVTAIRAYAAAMRGDAAATRRLADEALDLLPPGEEGVRSVVGFVLGGTAFLGGDLPGAAAAFAEAAAGARSAGNAHLAISAATALASIRLTQGRLREAAGLYREAVALADGRPLPAAGNAAAHLGDLLREWNDLDAALKLVTEGVAQSLPGTSAEALVHRHVAVARICLAQGSLDAAEDALAKAGQLLRSHQVPPTSGGQFADCRVRLWLTQGNLAAAAGWADEQRTAFPPEGTQVALARVALAQGRAAEALALLDPLAEAAAAGGRTNSLIGIALLQAVALHGDGNTPAAVAALQRALAQAGPEGYVRVFLDEGAPVAALLRLSLAQPDQPGPVREYARRLLSCWPGAGAGAGAGPESPLVVAPTQPPVQPLVEPLSERELEVLRLIAGGLTNEEIGQRLFIAVPTVKRHITNLYGKLGVTHRTQAVARAREYGLLDTTPGTTLG